MRNSNIEMLRIVCILMIITMHVFGEYKDISDSVFRHTCTFVNAFSNSAVTIFILISGYYGIKPNMEKWVSLFSITTFYGWVDLIIHSILPPPPIGGLEFKEMVKDFMPVFCNKYWFITSYMMLMALSGYIQRLIDSFSRKEFLQLIGILSLFVIIAPTIFLLEIFKDSGKGFVNMLTVYFIGRYFAKYSFPRLLTRYDMFLIPSLIILIFLLNEILLVIGLPMLVARDNNIMIVLLSIAVFHVAIKMPHTINAFINTLSRYCLSLYIIHAIFVSSICIYMRTSTNLYPLAQVVISTPILFGVSILIEGVRKRILGKIFNSINHKCTTHLITLFQ